MRFVLTVTLDRHVGRSAGQHTTLPRIFRKAAALPRELRFVPRPEGDQGPGH